MEVTRKEWEWEKARRGEKQKQSKGVEDAQENNVKGGRGSQNRTRQRQRITREENMMHMFKLCLDALTPT